MDTMIIGIPNYLHKKAVLLAVESGKTVLCTKPLAMSGPHSDWFWTKELSGGGAIVDMGCHCIEIARNFIGAEARSVRRMPGLKTMMKTTS